MEKDSPLQPSTNRAAVRQRFSVIVKPAGARCNLDCKYCFYLTKDALYPMSDFRMSTAVLERYIKQLLESQPAGPVTLVWQGGEPTIMGLDFFKRVVELVGKYRRPEHVIGHAMQTNGLLVNNDWAAFMKTNNFLVGLSLDGPKELHDVYRVHRNGAGSFDQARRSWEILRGHEVEVNILCAVHTANASHGLNVYRFFRDELGAEFIQFIPIVEWVIGQQVSEYSVCPEQFGRFLISVFDEWFSRDVGRVFVQAFDVALAAWMGEYPLCVHAPTCGNALALEHNGDLYACDHFVESNYLLGNIQDAHMLELVSAPQQRLFGQAKQAALPDTCLNCEVRFACHGGCPKDRFTSAHEGEPGLNYLCAGYRAFFRHIHQPMQKMSELLKNRQP